MSKRKGLPMAVRGRVTYALVVLLVIAGLGVSGWLVWSAFNTYKTILTADEDNSPYAAQYQAETFPGIEYMNAVVKDAPEGFDTWNLSSEQDKMKMLPDNCSSVEGSNALLAQKMASGDGYSVTVQVYGAGQARTQYEKLKASLLKCYPDSKQTDESVSYDKGELLTYGDTIVSIIADDADKLGTLESTINERVVSNLMQTGCVALNETVDDAKRSFYYDRNSFTGLIEKETVTQDVNLLEPSIPTVLGTDTSDLNATLKAVFTNPKDDAPTQPSDPLPSGITTTLPDTPAYPSIAALPSKPSDSKDIYYQVADTDGPGCGWKWSGQAVPTFDTDTLNTNHSTLVKNAKAEIKKSAEEYNTSVITWSKQTATALSFETSWDTYTEQVNTIYTAWKGLNERRDALKTPWYNYIQGLQEVVDFDESKAAAATSWNNAVKSCISTEKAKDNSSITSQPSASASPSDSSTDDSSGSNSSDNSSDSNNNSADNTGTGNTTDNNSGSNSSNNNSSSNSTTTRTDSEITSYCIAQTTYPSILTQSRPAIPTAPTIPDNTTIPNDWPSATDLLKQIQNPPSVDIQYKKE